MAGKLAGVVVSALLFGQAARAATYYIDYASGSDSNNGLSKAAPWKRQPYMTGFSGGYGHAPGDQFIFKGGVTWPVTAFQMHLKAGGSSDLVRDYYGVDTTWFSGASWTRPIFDFQDTQIGTGWNSSAGIWVDTVNYVTFDSLELKRHRGPTTPSGADWGACTINLYGSAAYVTVNNCYFHDWSIPTPLAGQDGGGTGGICQVNGAGAGIRIIGCTFTQANSSVRSGCAVHCWCELANCEIYQVPNAFLGSGYIHDNHIHDIMGATDPSAHENALYTQAPSNVYNNRVHDLNVDCSAIYLSPSFSGGTGYDLVYNNVVYNCGNQAPIQVDLEGNYPSQTGSKIYNNTLEHGNTYCVRVVQRGTAVLGLLDCRNNHFISSGTALGYNNPSGGCANVNSVTVANNLTQTQTDASNSGYTFGNQFIPTAASAPTVNAGQDMSGLFTTDLRGLTRPTGAWDVGAYEYLLPAGPTLAPVSNQTVAEGNLLAVPLSANDPAPGAILTYALISGPSGATVNPATGVFTWTPNEAQGPSTTTVTVQVSDNGSPALTDSKSFSVVATEVNSPPVLAAVANQAMAPGNLLSLSLNATDPDIPANTLTYSLVSGPAGAAVNSTSGLFTWIPLNSQAGNNTVTVQVSDNGTPVLTDTKSFTVVVTAVNRPPVLSAVANQTVAELTQLTVPLTATDPDPGTTLTYTLISGPSGAAVNPATGVFTWTPNEAQGPSTSTVTVQVSDNGSPALTDTKSFSVAVTEVNSPPVLAAVANQAAAAGSLLSLSLSATDPDIPANTLSYSLVSGPVGAAVNSTSGLFTWIPLNSQAGNNTVTVQVSDNGAPVLTDTKSFTVVVTAVNHSPVLSAIANQTVAELTQLTVPFTATDPDPGTTLTYTLISGPSGAALNPATGVFTWTPNEAQGPSTSTVTVQVSDNGSPALTDTKSFSVAVTEVNSPPVLAAVANQAAAAGSLLSVSLNATDADIPANTLTYTLVSGPAGAAVNSTSGLFTWIPLNSQAGNNTVTVQVSDNGTPVLTDTKSFNVVVTAVNHPPVLSAVANQTVAELTQLTVPFTATDPDPGTTLTYTLISGPSGAALNPATGVFTWTPNEAQGPSTSTVTVRVSDNGSPALTDSKSFSVVATEVNSAPTLNSIPDQKTSSGQTVSVTVTASDPDIPANKLTYLLVSGPTGAGLDSTTGAFTWRVPKNAGAATNLVLISVSDNGIPSLSDTKSFKIIVSGKGNSSHTALVPTLGSLTWNAARDNLPSIQFTAPLPSSDTVICYLEASSDFVHWSTVGELSAEAELSDPAAAQADFRFYRIRTQETPSGEAGANIK